MSITTGKVACAVALTAGAGLLLAACGGGPKRTPQDGPMADLTKDLMERIKPGNRGRLNVATEAVRQVTNDDGRPTGAYDGARLLRAADEHAAGTPTIVDPQVYIKGDGWATFNEIRHVVRSYDADSSGIFDAGETAAFQAAVDVAWIPA